MDLAKINKSILEHGDFTMYYYIDKGNVMTDVFISNKGEFTNEKGKLIHPRRATAMEVLGVNESIEKEKERIKNAQITIF